MKVIVKLFFLVLFPLISHVSLGNEIDEVSAKQVLKEKLISTLDDIPVDGDDTKLEGLKEKIKNLPENQSQWFVTNNIVSNKYLWYAAVVSTLYTFAYFNHLAPSPYEVYQASVSLWRVLLANYKLWLSGPENLVSDLHNGRHLRFTEQGPSFCEGTKLLFQGVKSGNYMSGMEGYVEGIKNESLDSVINNPNWHNVPVAITQARYNTVIIGLLTFFFLS